jgi:hypothetical protein
MTLRLSKRLILGALLTSVIAASFGQDRKKPEAVAVITSLSGNASVMPPAEKRGTVHVFDWLEAGSVLETGEGSHLAVVFANGDRYEMGDSARLTVTASGPKALKGTTHRLDSIPPIPRLTAIGGETPVGLRSGAIRLRQGSAMRIRRLYPRIDCVTLPDKTAFRFGLIDGAARYRVELEDETGKTIFEAETQSSPLSVPPGILRPGAPYYWKVRTVEGMGPSVRGEAEFETLEEQDIVRRTALRAALLKMGDVDSLALLANIDLRLGLLVEAREDFQAALDKSPNDPALVKAISEIDAQLSSD